MSKTSLTPVILILLLCSLTSGPRAAGNGEGPIAWQDWSDDLFARAERENKMVIMDLEAVWCHWCHVMEAKTYSDPIVADLINAHFIPVRVDADANPAIAARYGRWGWPATIVWSAEGEEIVKRRGYIPAIGMQSMLEAIIADPSPGPSVWNEPTGTPTAEGSLSPELRGTLLRAYHEFYDPRYGGWGRIHRFVNAPATEFAIEQARLGRRDYELIARLTLHNGLHLLDPEWGGVYQYSDRLDWQSPHFEKIMVFQAENLRLYSLAYARWGDEEHLRAAESIFAYVRDFLRDDRGGFYTSQDADLSLEVNGHAYFKLADQQRRALGIPRIDRNIYARENGWMIRALLALYAAGGNAEALQAALDATDYILEKRRLPDGGFRHGETDTGGPFLGDNQAMAQAFIALYQSTGERRWLAELERTLAFIEAHFRNPDGGYNSAAVEPAGSGVFAEPFRQVDEIAALARTANLAAHYTASATAREIAKYAMRYLAAPELSDPIVFQPAILLADYEINHAPAHITIVGDKQDPRARALYAAARAFPGSYLRLDWWDRNEGPLPNADVVYPDLDRPAAFVCSDNACSLPIYSADEIVPRVAELYARDG